MNISSFIGVSSAVLIAWLTITFIHQVPSGHYPRQDRTTAEKSDSKIEKKKEMIAVNLSEKY